jgi:hypothetical protein
VAQWSNDDEGGSPRIEEPFLRAATSDPSIHDITRSTRLFHVNGAPASNKSNHSIRSASGLGGTVRGVSKIASDLLSSSWHLDKKGSSFSSLKVFKAHSQSLSLPPMARRFPSGISNQQYGDVLWSANFCCSSSSESSALTPFKKSLQAKVEPGLVLLRMNLSNLAGNLSGPTGVTRNAPSRDTNTCH